MEEPLPTGADGTERLEPVDLTGIPSLPPEVSAKEQEVRRLVEAGASSPEELRALAAKLQERRTYEDEVWRREVRPALMQSKKRRSSDVPSYRDPQRAGRATLRLGAALLGGMVLLLLIATQTSIVLLLLPVIGVLVYAWVHGRRIGDAGGGSTLPPPDHTD